MWSFFSQYFRLIKISPQNQHTAPQGHVYTGIQGCFGICGHGRVLMHWNLVSAAQSAFPNTQIRCKLARTS